MTGLLHIAKQEQCIDLSRVAVHGWSYGTSPTVLLLLLLLLSFCRRLHVHHVSSTESKHLQGECALTSEGDSFVVGGHCWSTSDNVGGL